VIEVDMAPAMETLRVVLPRVPHIVAQSMKSIDPEVIARALSAANGHRMSEAELRRVIERVRISKPDLDAMRVRLENMPRFDPKELEARIRVAMPSDEMLRRHAEIALRANRHGLEEGARGIEQGAAKMEATARRFRDRDERERIIERERERGRTVTHEDLLEAAEGLEKGARGMRDSARQMRRGDRGHGHHD
jgi:hypothetical protein